mmetsp:Transcript_3168/g.8772  ORF Transcript_3168/g.8772 Transcript_3168/m.8772 type:complete len:213 (+) Transcript_3168:1021-1659(+)|eukprot:365040-Chlamydomonas_euryale.AAC.9
MTASPQRRQTRRAPFRFRDSCASRRRRQSSRARCPSHGSGASAMCTLPALAVKEPAGAAQQNFRPSSRTRAAPRGDRARRPRRPAARDRHGWGRAGFGKATATRARRRECCPAAPPASCWVGGRGGQRSRLRPLRGCADPAAEATAAAGAAAAAAAGVAGASAAAGSVAAAGAAAAATPTAPVRHPVHGRKPSRLSGMEPFHMLAGQPIPYP